jgi:DNA-binding NarL/FixJ family response regulator
MGEAKRRAEEEERLRQVTMEEAESYNWWSQFLTARMYAIKCMAKLGKTNEEITDTLNFSDNNHVARLIMMNRVERGPRIND